MFSFLRKFTSSNVLKSRESCIHDIINPLIVIASLVGLLPHSVKFSKSKNIFKIIPHSIYLNFINCVVIAVLLLAFSFLHIRYMLGTAERSQFNEKVTSQLNYILEVIIFAIFCIVTFTCGFFYRTTYIKIFNMIISTWRTIPPTKKAQMILEKFRFQRNIILLGLFVTLVSQMGVNLSRRDRSWKKVLVGFTFNMPQIIQLIMHAYYTMLVLAVAAIIENVNSHCQLHADSEFPSYSFIDVKSKTKTMSLSQMELIYIKAFDIKTYINRVFEGPMLASILQCFHSVVSEAHVLYYGLLVDTNITTHELINCSTWITYQLAKIYSLAYSGSALKIEALKTGQILHCIPIERQDLRRYMEVQHFSTLLKYQSIEINIYGYFPLDATLIFNMFASATMYLIILVQFDNSN